MNSGKLIANEIGLKKTAIAIAIVTIAFLSHIIDIATGKQTASAYSM